MPIGTLVIRADATPQMGTGHAMRCLALAQAWRKKGGDASFVMANLTPFVAKRLSWEGFDVHRLKASPGSKDDASATGTITAKTSARWLVVDGYHFNAEYLKAIRHPQVKPLLIDDLGREDCDHAELVLNQNLHAKATMYPGMVHHRLLLGPRFALLRNEFVRPGNSPRRFPEVAQNVVVSIGGGFQDGTLEIMLAAIALLPFELNVKLLVSGRGSPELGSVSKRKIDLQQDVKDMRELMDWADVAVSAAGSTCWEFCRAGLPSIVVDVAPNQLSIAQELDSRGISTYVPRAHLSPEGLANVLCRLIQDGNRRREMSDRGMKLVDGKGSARVVSALRARSIRFRKVVWKDSRLLWEWANDPKVRSASFFSEQIPWEVHCDWMRQKLADPEARLWIAQEEDLAVGVVRLQVKTGSFAEIAITVGPELRGDGLASHLIRSAADCAAKGGQVQQLQALIKPQNMASRRAFEAAGFRFCEMTSVNGLEAMKYVWQSDVKERRKNETR